MFLAVKTENFIKESSKSVPYNVRLTSASLKTYPNFAIYLWFNNVKRVLVLNNLTSFFYHVLCAL